ncbi:hypothetical protein RMCBS344292_06407 [Rhizopus microsporus]|uniref:chitin synthase n=1 Tax=Rhizopus microsporus TaxID=58291 RepID=A0A0A1NHP7_RHIZD|nr:hypothetical protein BCV71DRAFT_62917 [Rhizopus microsporus]CEI92136.1 hypothetical protein RMCBS344292_06407 [Rhizopus microsporus]
MKDSKPMRQPSCRRIIWVAFAKLCTFPFPDAFLKLIGLSTQVRRQAWREKVAIFTLYILISGLFCFWLEFITTLFCDPPKTYDFRDIYTPSSHYSTINGQVIDWRKYGNSSEMTKQANKYPQLDLSPMFPTFMLLQRPTGQKSYNHKIIDACINGFNRSEQADNWLNYKLTHDPGYRFENGQLLSCPLPTHRNKTGAPCFYTLADQYQLATYPKKGAVSYDRLYIENNCTTVPREGVASGRAYVILDNKVLDVTDYLQGATNVVKVARDIYSRAIAVDRMFLPLDLTVMLFINLGKDITKSFNNQIPNPARYKECLNTLFYHGVVDGNTETGCAHINVALWITMGCFLLYFLLKMNLANLTRLKFVQRFLFQSRSSHLVMSFMPYTLLFVPFYSESAETIRQTVDSLARTSYPDSRKLLFFVCDGIVKSKSAAKDNYLCLLDALGYSSAKDPELRAYVSLGQGSRKVNFCKVYAGFYESGRNRVPFLMAVKVGSQREEYDQKRAPGNRGKRDSMLIVLSFLERCLNLAHNRISPLEFELFNQCYNLLGIDPRMFKYMLVTDADTQVQDDVVHRLVSRLEADPKMLAVSGHVRPANPEENLITMLQIFPIYMTYYSGLAYEACLGGLTTLSGGFVMYRLWTPDETRQPKWPKVSDEIMVSSSSTMWKKNSSAPVSGSSSSSSSSEDDTQQTRRRRHHHRRHKKSEKPAEADQHVALVQSISLPSQPLDVQPVCIHPTVLRGFAAPRPDTLHMENILLLGEEQYFSIVLLRSHPNHCFGFEPEAIAYATLPTHFLALQGLQIRNLRATLHTQVEFQHTAKHLGIMYWIMSLIKLLDMIFSMPIIVYLYNVFIRYFLDQDLAYAIIAGSFAGLIMLHIFYFMLRRQFKYVLWFILYCAIGVPLFHVYFPLLAVWCSDYSHRWYDVWPTQQDGYHGRLHGIIDTDEPEDNQTTVNRMRLSDFEILEAEKTAQREKEQADMLDAKFHGFQGYVGRSEGITLPPLAQIRRHQRYGSAGSMQSNPFVSSLDSPLDDEASLLSRATTSSQSSIHRQHEIDRESCHYSLSNSVISLEPYPIDEESAEGRSAPVHSKIASHYYS